MEDQISIKIKQRRKCCWRSRKITRGTVEPGVDLPLEYDQMIFDPETQQWKSKNETTLNHGTFASIEDLVDNDQIEVTKQQQQQQQQQQTAAATATTT